MRNLSEYLIQYAAAHPQAKLLGEGDQWLSAAQVRRLTDNTAAEMARLGLKQGDLVVVRTDQSVRTAIILFAVARVGATAVLLDPRADLDAARFGTPMILGAGICRTAAGTFPLDPAALPDALAGADSTDPNGPSFVLLTSGSTGEQKAVVLSQANLIENLLESAPLGDYRPGDLALGAVPMDHVFGQVLLFGTVVLGYGLYLLAEKEAGAVLAAIEKQRLTRMNGVPSLYLAMAEHRAGYDLGSLRCGFIGGGPWTAEQFCRLERELDMTLISVYGMSECVGISCASYQDPQAERAGGVGRVYPGNDVVLLSPEGREAPTGQVGEICVRGPMRMLGYWQEDPLPPDALFHTGDLGRLDGNRVLHLTGRIKDIIIRNGRNLSARKIEEALLSIPGVNAAAVVGLPDPAAGELPYAMVAGPAPIAAVYAFLAEKLPKNELPVEIVPVEVLPTTLSGKPDKEQIREELAQWRKA